MIHPIKKDNDAVFTSDGSFVQNFILIFLENELHIILKHMHFPFERFFLII